MTARPPIHPPSLRRLIELADGGDFAQALDCARAFEGLVATDLLAALAAHASEPAQLGAWFAQRSATLATHRLFSTWDLGPASQWLDRSPGTSKAPRLRFEGNGLARTTSHLELVTLGPQHATVALEGLPGVGSYVVHLLAQFPSNVGDNFYLSLEGRESSETLRMSNAGVTLVTDGSVHRLNARTVKLYTLYVTPESVRLYINGMLQKSGSRTRVPNFERLALRLVGEHGPDLGGSILGLDVQHSTETLATPFTDDRLLFLARMQELVEAKDLGAVYPLLRGVAEAWAQDLDHTLLDLLHAKASERGVQEWVFDEILKRVSPARARDWVQQHRSLLPTPILSVRNLGAEFMVSPNKRFALTSVLTRKGRERFRVLDGVNFDVFPGDILGIIGPNGAGKSTLLRAVAGLMPIHQGEIVLRAQHLLLSAGLGARNELTGRENIYLAGTFMGLAKKQIDALLDEILEFSELGASIDKPFKYYSDGMKGRLVFSLATSVSPHLLMLDELLSAGDIKFQKKAADRMEQLLNRAHAVIVVTHSTGFVAQRCNKALLMSGGKLAAYGDPQEVIAHYLSLLHLTGDRAQVDLNPDVSPTDVQIQSTILSGGFGHASR